MLDIRNSDCMEVMQAMPDKWADIAIVDPPYNVGASDGNFGAHPGCYRKDLKHYANHNLTPGEKYFGELFRVSKNQIIWGMNYYPQYLYHSGAIIWFKKTGGPLSDAEIAFQSFSKLVLIYQHKWTGFRKESSDKGMFRIHPNQKPVALYEWLLTKYAKKGDKILDTHGGSMSIAIACHNLGFDLTAAELDKDYYDAAMKRITFHQAQKRLFEP